MRLLILFTVIIPIISSLLKVNSIENVSTIGRQINRKKENPAHESIILMISDGLGPSGVTLARQYMKDQNINLDTVNSFDKELVGAQITRSLNSYVTDSAAAATAFACGVSVPNKHIGVDGTGKPCLSILERAKSAGYLTGVVTNTAIVDATPASFTSHVISRKEKQGISLQQVSKSILTGSLTADLLVGGGAGYFRNKNTIDGFSNRTDFADINKIITNNKWNILYGRNFVDQIIGKSANINEHKNDDEPAKNLSLPLLNPTVESYYMSYQIDRNPVTEPSLSELTLAATSFLQSNLTPEHPGFFLIIEGGLIDTSGHDNDPATHIREVIEYFQSFSIAKKFVDAHKGTTLISLSDHETGGLTLTANYYDEKSDAFDWNFANIDKTTISLRKASQNIHVAIKNNSFDDSFVNMVVNDYLKLDDPTSDEIASVSSILDDKITEHYTVLRLARIIEGRTNIKWATNAHTSVDTLIYAYGKYRNEFTGVKKSVDIGKTLHKIIHDKVSHHGKPVSLSDGSVYNYS